MQKIKNNKNQEKIIKLLIKKAEGFFIPKKVLNIHIMKNPKRT